MYRGVPSAEVCESTVSVHSTAAGAAARAARYASLPMNGAAFTFGLARPASTGLYSGVSSAPKARYPFSSRAVVP
jgi:hypothetical protein